MIRYLFIFLLFPIGAKAQYIDEVLKGGKAVLIQLEGDIAKPGEYYFALDEQDRKRALIKILKRVSDDKAIGKLRKGIIKKGWHVLKAQKKSHIGRLTHPEVEQEEPEESKTTQEDVEVRLSKAGNMLFFNYAFNYMDVNNKDSSVTTLRGNDYGGEISLEYGRIPQSFVHIYANFSYLPLNVKEVGLEEADKNPQKACSGAPIKCYVETTYLGASLFARVVFLKRPLIDAWLGGGVGVNIPIKKESNLIEEESIKYLGHFSVGAGLSVKILKQVAIPLQVTYSRYLLLGDITPETINLQSGIAIKF